MKSTSPTPSKEHWAKVNWRKHLEKDNNHEPPIPKYAPCIYTPMSSTIPIRIYQLLKHIASNFFPNNQHATFVSRMLADQTFQKLFIDSILQKDMSGKIKLAPEQLFCTNTRHNPVILPIFMSAEKLLSKAQKDLKLPKFSINSIV